MAGDSRALRNGTLKGVGVQTAIRTSVVDYHTTIVFMPISALLLLWRNARDERRL